MIFELGPHQLGEEPTGALWTVIHYTQESYEGSGELVSLLPDGQLHIYNLGHCSCYGPLDNSPVTISPTDFLANLPNIHGYIHIPEVEDKVRELLTNA